MLTFLHHTLDAIIGENGRNHKRLLRDTGCHRIELRGHASKQRGSNRDLMEVILKGTSREIESAQRNVEDSIVNTVPKDQRGRMLYYLAKENNYGASDGLARYQRSPCDRHEWLWMAAIGVPTDFYKYQAISFQLEAKLWPTLHVKLDAAKSQS